MTKVLNPTMSLALGWTTPEDTKEVEDTVAVGYIRQPMASHALG